MEKVVEKNERKSGIELLRIIAILLICLSHAVQTSELFLDFSLNSFGIVVLSILRYSGQIGNVIFIICSSYFLTESSGIKRNKAFKILFDSMCISILIFICYLISGYRFGLLYSIKQILPDVFSNMWFIPIYVLFYLIHPMLNSAINGLSQKQHFSFCFIVFVVYGILGFLFNYSIGLNFLLDFIIVYFVVSYMKKYCSRLCENFKLNFIIFVFTAIIFVFLAVIKKLLNLKYLFIDSWTSPLLLIMLLSLFNIFNSFKFINKKINYLASCSLFVYCFHENILLRSFLRPKYYEFVMNINPNIYFLWIMLCGIGMFVIAYLISILYKITFSKLTNWLSKKVNEGYEKLLDYILKDTKKKDTE